MANATTLRRFEIQLSDTDRGVYEALDLRAAQHPSETVRYLLTRTLGLCLHYEEGIAFSRGLSATDEPAVWVQESGGRIRLWMDVGHPTAERLHKASKASDRVVVCTNDGFEPVRRIALGERVHRAESIELCAFPRTLLDALEAVTDRTMRWDVVHTGGVVYVTTGTATYEGVVERGMLAPST